MGVSIVASGAVSCDDIRFESQRDDGLDDGREHERPCPPAVGDVHPGCATDGLGECGGEAFAVVVTSRRRTVGDVRLGVLGLISRVGGVVWVVVQIDGLTSQEGCARLVVRNFGRVAAAKGGWSAWI
jgi:hypothetical protein